jgi:hypothetical protein
MIEEKDTPEEITEDHKNLGFYNVRNGSVIVVGRREG